jgi:hypothetical protein
MLRLNVSDATLAESSLIESAAGDFHPIHTRLIRLLWYILPIYASLRQSGVSSTMSMQNLTRSADPRSEMVKYIGLLLGSGLVYLRWRSLSLQTDSSRPAGVITLVTLLLFLSGRVRERDPLYVVLGSRPGALEPSVNRINSTEFLSRYLLTDSLSSILLAMAPLINFRRIFNRARSLAGLPDPDQYTACSVCGSRWPVLPILGPCRHPVCRYCSHGSPECNRCGEAIH